MTDKEKIKNEIVQRMLYTMDEHMAFYSKEAEADYKLLSSIENFINSLPEEPVSEDLEKELSRLLKDCEIDSEYIHQDFLHIVANHFADWQKERMMKNIWKPADGDALPEYDREVIAILDYDFGHYKVVYAHRPNPNGWNGTNIDTEEKEHFEPVIYDKGGWNQPHILYWLDARLPYEEKN